MKTHEEILLEKYPELKEAREYGIDIVMLYDNLQRSVEERIREFGILRVIGSKKQYIIKMVLFEGLLFGVIGSIIGITLGIIFTPLK